MPGPFKADREEIRRGMRVVVALFALELVNHWAESTDMFDAFAKAHGFNEEYLRIALRVVIIVIFALFLVLLEVILRRNEAKISRNLSGLKKFECAWAQNCSLEERPYSLSVIEFSEDDGRWNYFGVGFNEKFEPAAEWQTQSLFYEESRREWFFGGPARRLEYDALAKQYFPKGGQGSVTAVLLLGSSTEVEVRGVVADFDVGDSHGPFRINLRPAPEKYKDVFRSAAALVALKPQKVKEILIDSGVTIREQNPTTG